MTEDDTRGGALLWLLMRLSADARPAYDGEAMTAEALAHQAYAAYLLAEVEAAFPDVLR